ncbi:MAG: PqiC family protein, partial [Planctomycetota bacterium]
FPWSVATPADYRIVIDIVRFDGQLGERALLEARWTILRGDGDGALVRRKSSFEAPTDGEGYEALVAAHSRTLADLAREMAAALRDIIQEAPGG